MIRTIQKEPREKNNLDLLANISQTGKKITVIVGICKNAGKTTFLNWLLTSGLYSRLGVISTGRDGEETDIIDGHKKPRVSLPANALFTTNISEISRLSPYLTIREKLIQKAGGKNLWLVEANTPIETEIIGPPSVKEQIETAKKILRHGAEHVFIDGSLDRKAISASIEVDSLVFVLSPVFGALPSLKKELRKFIELSEVKEWQSEIILPEFIAIGLKEQKIGEKQEIRDLGIKSLLGHEKEVLQILSEYRKKTDFLYLPGSITDKSLALLKAAINELSHLKIIVKHPFNIKLDDNNFKLVRSKLLTLNKMNISAVAVNSFAVNGNHIDCEQLRSTVRSDLNIPVVDVQEVR